MGPDLSLQFRQAHRRCPGANMSQAGVPIDDGPDLAAVAAQVIHGGHGRHLGAATVVKPDNLLRIEPRRHRQAMGPGQGLVLFI